MLVLRRKQAETDLGDLPDRDGRFTALARELGPLGRDGVRVQLLGPWSCELAGWRIEETAGVDLLVPPSVGSSVEQAG